MNPSRLKADRIAIELHLEGYPPSIVAAARRHARRWPWGENMLFDFDEYGEALFDDAAEKFGIPDTQRVN